MSISYEDKKNREKQWYEKKETEGKSYAKRMMHHPMIFSPARNSFNYIFPKTRMAEFVKARFGRRRASRILIAPCGTGDDAKYLGQIADEVHGIDLSPVAIEKCRSVMNAREGDILDTGYPNDWFDLVASPLFFHHMVAFGFDRFLEEMHRILRPGGGFVALEPSLWYPLNLVTRPLKRILGNPYDEVQDEGPFRPAMMLRSLKRVGFANVHLEAASFSHCSFYVPIAKIANWLTRPFLRAFPFKYFGWLVLYWAEKDIEIQAISDEGMNHKGQ